MADLTPEQLDEARAKEAVRIVGYQPTRAASEILIAIRMAARLAREGWTPVDPDLIEAREVAARDAENTSGTHWLAAEYRRGQRDAAHRVAYALAAIKRGRELEREGW